MPLATHFQQTVRLLVAQHVGGQEVRDYLAAAAERRVAGFIRDGTANKLYRRYVNGIEGAANNTIRLDGTGRIEYNFAQIQEAAGYALKYCQDHSPRSGKTTNRTPAYADSWYMLIDRQPVTDISLIDIPQSAEVAISNFQPYHRKIDVGAIRLSVAPQIIEAARQAVMRRYPQIDAQRIFITIPNGYVLKGRSIRSGLSFSKKAGFVRNHPPHFFFRKDTAAGQQMTYPTLVLRQVT